MLATPVLTLTLLAQAASAQTTADSPATPGAVDVASSGDKAPQSGLSSTASPSSGTAQGAAAGQTSGWRDQPLPPGAALARDFGAIGLTAEINSDEYFGALQARLGAYTALSSGGAKPDLSLQNVVVPAHVTFPLTGGGRWFLKLGAAGIESWARDHGSRLETTTTVTGQVELQFHPRAGTLIGVGVTYETNAIDLAGGGHVKVPGPGLRFDVLQRLGEHVGFAAKIEWADEKTTTTIPLGTDLTLRDRTDTPRTYAQLGLIGMIQHKDAAFIPDGWSLRPMAHLIVQRTAIAASTNSLGEDIAHDHQDFGEAILTTRLQKDVFRSFQVGPFVESGAEIEMFSTVPTPASDPFMAYAKAGAYMRVGNWGFLDAYYAYRNALNGHYRSGTVELLLSVTF